MRTLLLHIIIFLFTASGYSQIAVVNYLKAGGDVDEKVIKSLYESINKQGNIKQVIFIGSLTANGKIEELDLFNNSLEWLSPDDYILPGYREIVNNPKGFIYIKEMFDGTKIRLDSSGLFLAGLSNYSPRGNNKSFSTSDLKWLDSLFKAVHRKKKLLFFSSAPLEENSNWTAVYNLMAERNIKFYIAPGKDNSTGTFNGLQQITFKPSTERSSWNYNIISQSDDSLYFTNISGDTLNYTWATLSLNNQEITFPVDTVYEKNFNAEVVLSKNTGKDIPAPVITTDDKIFYVSALGEVEALDYTGKSIWKINLSRTVIAKSFRDRDLLIIGTAEGDLFSVNANNGNIVQVIGTDEPIVCDPVFTSVENLDGKYKAVLIGSPSGRIACYDIYTFELLWENNSSQNRITHILADQGKLFFTSIDGNLYSADLSNGNLIWKWNPGKNINITSFPVPGEKFIYAAGSNKTLYAIDLLLGTTAWKKTDFGQPSSVYYSKEKNELIVKTSKDEIITADATAGKIIKRIKTGFPEDNTHSFILENSSEILFSSSDGIIRRVTPDDLTEYLYYLGGGQITNFTKTSQGSYLISNDKGTFTLIK